MEEIRLRRLGVEKTKKFQKDFDILYAYYKDKALESGYDGELKFITEKSRVFIYVVI